MEKEIGRINKNDRSDIIIRIDDFADKRGLTIREFVTSDKYTGFTKAGVRIVAADFAKFKEMINSVNEKDMMGVPDKTETPTRKAPAKTQKKLSNEEELPDY